MLVRLTQPVSGQRENGVSYRHLRGAEIEVNEDEGRRMIAGGIATAVTSPLETQMAAHGPREVTGNRERATRRTKG